MARITTKEARVSGQERAAVILQLFKKIDGLSSQGQRKVGQLQEHLVEQCFANNEWLILAHQLTYFFFHYSVKLSSKSCKTWSCGRDPKIALTIP